MVEMDYIFARDDLVIACRNSSLVSDYTLAEWEMLMRLRIDDVEVFGQSEEEYRKWREHLARHNSTLQVPSSAWALLSVLSIAASVDSAFDRLKRDGRADIDSLDCVLKITRQGGLVSVAIGHDRVGRTSFQAIYTAFAAFAQRVREDFLTVCPQLRDHVTLGVWFRGEDTTTLSKTPPDIIYLP